ncbi:phospho-N-acetylmuramoyl-pentapeptide-transferase [bacterium (Candidatus Blackallbacteria) CG17_big_fil_post_rev_8_21_14_2_50_48_46]|uniref:Phospho-N-acetylmuramoyl-pentapeptide-transferase n=1 Tax=bacterium (Candidatus Blackallbacteria) CG17_big_fil_post_rev_8_21_14_2_50_48_46 TaxID=2014261 RepID=A0A2M7FX56_9BACT|nr:MAG: phospho-N-acetylmuramoyl-pentapeptide-transferase [bacterium (Candidatus Blackallbacteria) CG18_big_fil_WC_8_21_14_2_50_49_26]PIW13715.1 MAG: phospho-N-acetylmuramoyl-pentapeptide-transferase [bacterium (Candidatus Blackallbacteria) CG17_big_fil_post_rev_8_21_14_2_50_48_46]PIW44941.1 MAG: phospho-N-acetylmuramoyl-pentapeptide-transferase [bacterium (Candidatus Blackallbacteria) CG13_big_fil_rev_8_21_14_2_50_49_14]
MQTLLALSTVPLTALLAVFFGRYAVEILRRLKLGQHIREEGPQSHLSKGGTPTMGGIIFLIPLLLVTFFFSRPTPHTLILIGLVVLTTSVGFIDDFQKIWLKNNKGITPKQKLAGQIFVGFLLGAYLQWGPPQHAPYTELPFLGADLPLGWLFVPFVILFFVSTTNAVNLTDGLDGLASSVALVTLATLTALLILKGGLNDPLMLPGVILGLSTIGGCLGFLWYNSHPAQVFMGDTGSLGLGGIIAVMAVLGHLELWFLLVGIIFVAEALSVVLQVTYFKKTRKRLFRMSPLHHHFELGGWKETQVVNRFSFVAVLFCLISFIGYYGTHGLP